MQQLCINRSVLSDARFARLMDASGWSRAEATGVLVLLWAHTRERAVARKPTRTTLLGALPFGRERAEAALAHLIDAGYVVQHDDAHVVVDNEAYFTAADKMSEAGKRGGYPAHKTKAVPKKRAPRVKVVKPPSDTAQVWSQYHSSYVARYATDPVRNARVNGQIADLVRRVGVADAVALAAFFLSSSNSWFVRNQHSVGDMLKNCEGLVVQMRRGQAYTEHQGRAESDAGALRAQLERLAGGA